MRRPLPRSVLGVLLGLVVALVELELIGYAYERAGVPARWVFAMLLLSIVGSRVDLPLRTVPGADGRPTVLAVNVGGALVPVALALWMQAAHGAWLRGGIAIAIVAVVIHAIARPVPGRGIAIPTLVPGPLAAVAALVVAPEQTPAVAYAAGALGTLIGADLTHLGALRDIGATVASIGGAGTFDGVFVTGIVAVLLA
jgi:uncharacterized membrane protein